MLGLISKNKDQACVTDGVKTQIEHNHFRIGVWVFNLTRSDEKNSLVSKKTYRSRFCDSRMISTSFSREPTV